MSHEAVYSSDSRNETGSLTVWKYLISNRAQESLLTQSWLGRGTDDQLAPVSQRGCCHSTNTLFLPGSGVTTKSNGRVASCLNHSFEVTYCA
jgi:hypothetical protein